MIRVPALLVLSLLGACASPDAEPQPPPGGLERLLPGTIGVVVRGMDSSNVDSVFIAGRARKRRGQLVDVDMARVRRLTYESRDYVVSTSGFTMPAI